MKEGSGILLLGQEIKKAVKNKLYPEKIGNWMITNFVNGTKI